MKLNNRVYTNKAFNIKGRKVKLAGWIHELRNLGKIKFLVLRDREGVMQVTFPKGIVSDELFDRFNELRKEAVIAVSGIVKISRQAPGGAELIPTDLSLISQSEQPVPLDISGKIDSSLDKRLDWRSIDLRSPKSTAVFKVMSTVVKAIHAHLQSKDFINITTPRILGVPAEGGSEVFPVIYFNKEAFLRQDPQLHRQLTIAGGFDKIYEVGPSWRAEQSHTTRHVCEHDTVACETAFIDDEYDVMRVEEELLVAVLKAVKKDCANELKLFGIQLQVPKLPLPVLEFPKVYELLAELGYPVKSGDDIDSKAESLLSDYVLKKFKSDAFFVNRFPSGIKPFYVMRVDGDSSWARSTDLIYRGLELSSGGQREHRYDKLMKQVADKKMTPSYVAWFTDVFKYGVPPHGGFSIGLARLVKQILGLENIRESILYPRDVERLIP